MFIMSCKHTRIKDKYLNCVSSCLYYCAIAMSSIVHGLDNIFFPKVLLPEKSLVIKGAREGCLPYNTANGVSLIEELPSLLIK